MSPLAFFVPRQGREAQEYELDEFVLFPKRDDSISSSSLSPCDRIWSLVLSKQWIQLLFDKSARELTLKAIIAPV